MINTPSLRKEYKEKRKLLRIADPLPEDAFKGDCLNGAFVVFFCMLLAAILLIGSCKPAHAEEYTNEQIVNAIKKAEGTWTYGIKTIPCKDEKECRKICLNTVKNNRRRYATNPGTNKDYIEFLSKRYCPIGASNDPKGLNRNWLKNVRYFLAKEAA